MLAWVIIPNNIILAKSNRTIDLSISRSLSSFFTESKKFIVTSSVLFYIFTLKIRTPGRGSDDNYKISKAFNEKKWEGIKCHLPRAPGTTAVKVWKLNFQRVWVRWCKCKQSILINHREISLWTCIVKKTNMFSMLSAQDN